MKKTLITLTVLLTLCFLTLGCKKKEEPPKSEEPAVTQTPTETATPTPSPTPETIVEAEVVEAEPIPDGMVKSYLTGEYVTPEIGRRRPVAVMINNVRAALPSAGISKAGVYYEAPVEGALTRVMAVFEDYDNLEKIGSVRSCRDYFLDYAMGFDAIYVHFGQAAYALPYLELPQINNISGLAYYGDQVFYRTDDRPSPHNAYTSGALIQKAIDICGYGQEYPEDYQQQFTFAWVGEEVTLPNGSDARVIRPGYMFNDPWFEYNPEDGLYYRFQYEEPHIDQTTGAQITVKNIIIQYTGWEKYDENGYLNLYAGEGGPCKYITNGKVIDGTWERTFEWGPEKYYDSDGNEITLNTGKTWICVVQDTYADGVSIS